MINQSSTHSWTKKHCQLPTANSKAEMCSVRCGTHGVSIHFMLLTVLYLYIYIYIYQLVGINIIWLVVWNMAFIFHFIWDVILPIDELIYFKMVETTNQYIQYISMGSGQKSLLRKSESSCEINFRQ